MVDVAPLGTAPAGPAGVDAGPGDERPPMVAALSPSSMATWHQCPKRFWFEKILRLPTDTNEPAVCGSFVHLVLQHLMGLPARGRTPDAAREIARSRWGPFTEEPESRFVELGLGPEQTRAFKHKAWTGITGYFRIEDPSRVDVVATEQEVKAELAGAPVYGIVDRVDSAPDGLVVTDYKSGKAPAWDDEREEKLRQLRTYAALLEATGRRVSELRLLFVSPQLAAAAKLERCRAEADAAVDALCAAHPREAVLDAIVAVEAAARAAREAVPEGGPPAREAGRAAATAAAAGAAGRLTGDTPPPADHPTRPAGEAGATVESLLLHAWDARRKAFFAGRALDRARPVAITLRVGAADLEMACTEAGGIWSEASACYDAWEFPGRVGPLCHWCPFADRCDDFQEGCAAGVA